MELINFIKNHNVIQHGDFQLASGKISTIYCDAKKITLDSTGLYLSCTKLLNKMREIAKFDAIGGMEVGAIPMVSAMLFYIAITGDAQKGFFVRKNPKGHGTKKFIEGPVEPNMRVAIVEDVTTTGGSAILAAQKAIEFGLKPVVIGSIIDRGEGAQEAFKAINIPFVSLCSSTELI